MRQVLHGGHAGDAPDLAVPGVDRPQVAGEAVAPEGGERPPAELPRIGRRAEERDRSRRQESLQTGRQALSGQ
jgi:hypothetical protein